MLYEQGELCALLVFLVISYLQLTIPTLTPVHPLPALYNSPCCSILAVFSDSCAPYVRLLELI